LRVFQLSPHAVKVRQVVSRIKYPSITSEVFRRIDTTI
jgi:hypothetical protein